MKHLLREIVDCTKKTVQKSRQSVSLKEIELKCKDTVLNRRLKQVLAGGHEIKLIAEYKRASPTAGVIGTHDIAETCGLYKEGGACAVSILTEENYFKGSLRDIADVKRSLDLPVLRKDFIIDVYQIFESIAGGADAMLLIAAILSKKELKEFLEIANSFGLDAIVEVHGRKELDAVLDIGLPIIGINNRNLDDFTVHLEVTEDLLKYIPHSALIVSESGFRSPGDITRFKKSGVNAVLVGEALMKADDIKQSVEDMVHAGRR